MRAESWRRRTGFALLCTVVGLATGGFAGAQEPAAEDVSQPTEAVPPAESEPKVYGSPFKAYEKGVWDQALDGFVDLQVERPDDSEVVYDVGSARYRLEDYEGAADAFSAAAATGDATLRSEALYNLGNTAYRAGRLDEAVERYKAALEADPDDADAKFNLEFVRREIERRKQEEQQQQDQQQGEPQDENGDQKPSEAGDSPAESSPQEKSDQDESDRKKPPQDESAQSQKDQDQSQKDRDQSQQEDQSAEQQGQQDQDGDGLPDQMERNAENPTDPTDADSDDDGLADGQEDRNANGRVDPGETDPNKSDSDGDGTPDGAEATGAPSGAGAAEPGADSLAAMTPEEAERYLQALEEMRPPHGDAARGRAHSVEKDW